MNYQPKWLLNQYTLPTSLKDTTKHSYNIRRFQKRFLIIAILAISSFSLLLLSFRDRLGTFENWRSTFSVTDADQEKLGGSRLGQVNLEILNGLQQTARSRGLANVRDLRILFLNHHFGTSSEMAALVHAIAQRNDVKITLKETWGIYEDVRSLTVGKKESDVYWEKAKVQECNPERYDIIIVGDTLSLIRPHLQNNCTLPMVASLTTRFDWAHEDDKAWKSLVSDASYRKNFRIYPNNLIESWYAEKRGINIKMHNYLPSSGIPSTHWGEALKTVNFTTSQPNDEELIIPDTVRIKECLSSHLDDRKISYKSFERNKYGGPLGLTDRIVVHIPYQSNTMSLFENLHQQVIYVLPTPRLYRELSGICSARIEKVPNEWLTEKDYERRIDWWRKDMQHLFFYFDSFDDLKEGSTLRKQIDAEADLKRLSIAEYMIRQKEYVLRSWEDIWFGNWNV